MKNWFVALGVVFCISLASNGYGQIDRSEEAKTLMFGLNSGSSSQRINTAKLITQSGIVDHDLYEKVATLLSDGYHEAYESNNVDEMSWLCKALASSGDTQYEALLLEIAENAPSTKLQHYARQSIGLIIEHADRNKILNSTTLLHPEFNEKENRLVHMLRSENNRVKRDAAKLIFRDVRIHHRVYDFAASELEEMLAAVQSDLLHIDTMGWLCKALASSGNPKFAETLEKVVATTENYKLKEHASKALRDFN